MRLTAPSGTSPKARFWQAVANEINARESSESAGMRTSVTTRGTHRVPTVQRPRRPEIYTVPYFELTLKPYTRVNNAGVSPTEPSEVINGFMFGKRPGEMPADLREPIPASSPYYGDSGAQSYRMESRRFKISWFNPGATGALNTAQMPARVGIVYSFSRVTVRNYLTTSGQLVAQDGWKTIGTNQLTATSQFFGNGDYTPFAVYVDDSIEAATGANEDQGGGLQWMRRDTLERSVIAFPLMPNATARQRYIVRSTKQPTAFYMQVFLESDDPIFTFDAPIGTAENGSVEFELGEDHYNTVVATGAVYFIAGYGCLEGIIPNIYAPWRFRVDSI